MKKLLLSILAVFVAWQILDYIIHGVILMGAYEETQNLWRPMEEMSMPMMMFVPLLVSAVFCYLYYAFVSNKNLNTAIKFGLIYGLGAGISFGYGSYTVMPIPYSMAFIWFLGTVVEATVAGLIVGLIMKPETASEQ
ncbi:MAG: hypothetical protein C4543_04925 [Ignavibacteriales bacterium]|jgi:hypothetical protein|nr:MAG: hypothetical protein C4543_04925 [Ignavibacteriales bacterium]